MSYDDQDDHEGPAPAEGNDPTEQRITSAFAELKATAQHARPEPVATPWGSRGRSPWLAPVLAFGVIAAIALGAVLVLSRGDTTNVATTNPETPTAPPVTALPEPTAVAPPSTAVPSPVPPPTLSEPTLVPNAGITPLVAEADGWFPWIFPTPSLSWYEEGCPSPESVARDFVANFRGEPDPQLTLLTNPGQNPALRQYLLHRRGEGGGVLTTGSELTLARVDPGVVDCEAWGVVAVDAPGDVSIGAPIAGSLVGPEIDVSGSGHGFEATVALAVYDERYDTVGTASAIGGSSDPLPFDGVVSLRRQPIDANVVIIAASAGGADGATQPFAAVKVRYDGSAIEPALDLAPVVGPVAVVGVAADDELFAHSGPGVDEPEVGSIGPFEIGIFEYDAEAMVGPSRWVLVGNPESRDFDVWVNARFLTRIEGESDQPPELYDAVTMVREALSLNRPTERLIDVIAGLGGDAVRVSVDGFFAEEDQVLSLADLGDAGTEADIDRLWGFTDGKGDPILATIDEIIASIGQSEALSRTERVSVNERIKAGNTIDNAHEFSPNGTVIELHFGGADNPDFGWSTLRLVFEPTSTGSWALVGIALDSWTI